MKRWKWWVVEEEEVEEGEGGIVEWEGDRRECQVQCHGWKRRRRRKRRKRRRRRRRGGRNKHRSVKINEDVNKLSKMNRKRIRRQMLME